MRTRQNGLTAAMAAGCVLAALACPMPGFAVEIIDDPVQIDERAAQVLQSSNSLCWEIHRYHQQKPDYAQQYRTAKEIWSRAGDLRNALRAGPVETEVLVQQMLQLNEALVQLEAGLSRWGEGDRSLVPPTSAPTPQTVVRPGVEVVVPFVGVRVGGPRVVTTEDAAPPLERRRLHPNSHGSQRSLEREFAAVKVAVSYLLEDSGVGAGQQPPVPNAPTPNAPVPNAPVPNPPAADNAPDAPAGNGPALGPPQKIVPPTAKKPVAPRTATGRRQ